VGLHPKRKDGVRSPLTPCCWKKRVPKARPIDHETLKRQGMIAAHADPVFIIERAAPEYLQTISIGIAQMGPSVTSAKKRPAARPPRTWRLCADVRGINAGNEQTMRLFPFEFCIQKTIRYTVTSHQRYFQGVYPDVLGISATSQVKNVPLAKYNLNAKFKEN
jgi:hypothetical protein